MDRLYAFNATTNEPFAFEIKPGLFSEETLLKGILTDDINLVTNTIAKYVDGKTDPIDAFIYTIKNSDFTVTKAPPSISTTSDLWTFLLNVANSRAPVASSSVNSQKIKSDIDMRRKQAIQSKLIPNPADKPTTKTNLAKSIIQVKSSSSSSSPSIPTVPTVPTVVPQWREIPINVEGASVVKGTSQEPLNLVKLFQSLPSS